MNNESKKQMWKSFGWDKTRPDAYATIGTPEHEKIMQEYKEQRKALEQREWYKVKIYFPKDIASGIVWDDEIQGFNPEDALKNAYENWNKAEKIELA